MIRNWKSLIAFTFCAAAGVQTWAQAPQFATLDIEWENAVGYIDDLADPSKLVTSPSPVAANIKNFMPFIDIGDIVSVNGKPARGAWLLQGRVITLFPSPTPGQAIGDLGRGAMADLHLEVLQSDGTRVGTIMTSGFTAGPAPPGSPAGSFGNFTVTGGTGGFPGGKGIQCEPASGISIRVDGRRSCQPSDKRRHAAFT